MPNIADDLNRADQRGMRWAARSAIMIVGAWGLPRVTVGITEASATNSPVRPCTAMVAGSTTDPGSAPIRQLPARWNSLPSQATAAELDINRTTLYKKMRKYRLDVGETNAA